MNEWNIQSRASACESCLKSFAHKEGYHTLLSDDREGYRRMDVCAACWQEKHAEDTARKGFISHWQGVYEVPPAAPADPIQKENAETLLRKIIESNDPKHAPTAFILAVMLERKRLLKVKEQFQRDGQRVFIYEQPRTGDLFTILDPNLQLNQLDQVQKDVASLLEHGLNPPPSVAEIAVVAPAAEAESEAAPVATTVAAPAEALSHAAV